MALLQVANPDEQLIYWNSGEEVESLRDKRPLLRGRNRTW